MIQTIDEPVQVSFSSPAEASATAGFPRPVSVQWAGRTYPILKVGLHHRTYKGDSLVHIFSVVSQNLFFRLELDTSSLLWRLTGVSDGEA